MIAALVGAFCGGLLPGVIIALVITVRARRRLAARRRAFNAEMLTARRAIANRVTASGDPAARAVGVALRNALDQKVR